MLRVVYLLYRVYCYIFRPITTGVRILLIQNRQAVLVRHTYLDGWYMPGGGVKRGETMEEAARREAREETGATLGAVKLMGVYTNFGEYKTDHNVVFLCEDFTFDGRHDGEIAEVRLHPLNELPQRIPAGHRRRIEEYVAGITNPSFGRW